MVFNFKNHIIFSKNLFRGFRKIVSRENSFLNRIFLEQLYSFGTLSFPMVVLVSFFLGLVLTFQLVPELAKFGSESVAGGLIMLSCSREVAPVMLAIMISGRNGSAMAAEIGSMKISDQIDALKLLGLDATQYLIAPKVLSGAIMMPFLSIISLFFIGLSSYILAIHVYGIGWGVYISRVASMMSYRDIILGAFKTIFFGVNITYISCYLGMNIKGRSAEIGQATTNSVAISIITIILINMLLSFLIFGR